MACQVALVVPEFEKLHVVVRSAAFAGSFLFVLGMRASAYRHPVRNVALVSLVVLGASILNPATDGIWAGFAAIILHIAIIGPVFWVTRVRVDTITVRHLFLVMWLFHTASAVTGALQVYFPDWFPGVFGSDLGDADLGMTVILADGSVILRPSGLTGFPGGASISAVYCVLIGIGLLLSDGRRWLRLPILGSMVLALVTVYLCQIRSLFIMLGVSVLSLAIPLTLQRKLGTMLRVGALVAAVGVLGTILAFSVGGQMTIDRFSTLIGEAPTQVYYNNRGRFMEFTMDTLLPLFPMGAGLGRWGMIHQYFTDRLTASSSLWVEIQWTAWLLDGGILLMIVYPLALLLTARESLRIAKGVYGSDDELKLWATIAFGHGVGAMMLTFNAPVFESNLGLDYWTLNIALYAAAIQARDVKENRAPFELESA